MSGFQLRPYQRAAVEAVYDHLRSRDDNPCVVLPTGAGKSLVIAQIAMDAVQRWGGRVIVLAHVQELLEQNADKIRRLCGDVPVGVYSAGLGRRDTTEPVIVAGIQSVYQRAELLGRFDLAVIDEVHMIPTEGEGMYRTFLAAAEEMNPHVRVIGLTATPYRMKSGLICTPDHFINHVCYEAGVREMIRDGHLCRVKSRAGKTKPDTSELHIRGGEFVSEEAEALMNAEDLVHAACEEIVDLTADRQAVLIFAAGVEHGRHVQEVLQTKHGVECGFVCGDTPQTEREELLARFRGDPGDGLFERQPLKYLCNVNVLTTGFDAPNIDCIVLLRPTASPGLFYQMCLDMETEVLTSSGWRRCHEVTVGDTVAAFDIDDEEIVYVPAIDKVHRALKPGESMFGVVSPHLNIRVTDQHMMVVRGRSRTCVNWRLQTAVEASRRRETYTIPVAGKGSHHRLDADIADEEVEFIGWFLTDGYMNRANRTVTISQSPKKYASEVRAVLTACDFGFREYPHARKGKEQGYSDGLQYVIPRGEGRGTNRGLRGWADLAAWLDKDVPAIFNTLSRRQFGILLHAMNRGNGRNAASSGYTTRVMSIALGCRQRMADRIQQLAIERGYRCNVTRCDSQPTEWNPHPQPQWMVYVKPQRVAYVGGTRKDRNIVVPNRCRIQPLEFQRNEWVWCLTTEKHTLVTRRNGKVAIVGNCGRGFRLHPNKSDCLILDYGGNVLRHGPIDQVKADRKPAGAGGPAPAKECPICFSLIAAGYARCPECDYEFPAREKEHDVRASKAGILSDDYEDVEYEVQDTEYSVHQKKNAPPDAPKSMRVSYRIGFYQWQSEWICFEHTGFARHKAEQWWRERSYDPVPHTAQQAVDLAYAGALAVTEAITVRSIPGEKYDRIVAYKLGPKPDPVELDETECDDVFSDEEVPF